MQEDHILDQKTCHCNWSVTATRVTVNEQACSNLAEDIDGDGGAVYDDGTNERRAKSLYVSSFTSAFLQIGEAEGGFMAVSLASLKHNTGWQHGEIWFRGSYIRRPHRTGCLKVP